MSEIKLFEVGTVVKERTSSTVVLEKQLQTTIEQNMETFFGVRFLKSEYMITSGRMDSIGIDENNSPVIFEYKRSTSENVINQGLFYLDWLLDHKADFKLLVIEKFALLAAVDISYLTEDEQKMLWDIMVRQGLKIKPAYAEKLRKESGNLTESG